jgi:hypothetical protein
MPGMKQKRQSTENTRGADFLTDQDLTLKNAIDPA